MHQLTVSDTFNATHSLTLADGQAEPVHGHDWRVHAVVRADVLDAIDTVMDFHELERLLRAILTPLQHSHLNDQGAFAGVNPSAERLAMHVAGELGPALPANVALHRLDVEEAPGCVASYFPNG